MNNVHTNQLRQMKYSLSFAIWIILLFMLSGCSVFHRYYPYKNVRALSPIETRLNSAVNSSNNLSIQTLGVVKYDEFSAPIWLISYYPENKGRYKVFIGGGIHGNEPAGVESIIRLIEALATGNKKFANTEIHLIPLLNPWGWLKDVRRNRDGVDISRKFSTIETQESSIVKQYLSGKQFDLMISQHEDGRDKGFYTLTFKNENLIFCQELATSIQRAGYPLRHWKGIDGYIHCSEEQTKKKVSQTFMLYARNNHTKNAYIIESIFTMALQDRLKQYSLSHDVLIRGVTNKNNKIVQPGTAH